MVFKYKKDDYNEINSIEDGNCAFNAYSLALVDLILGGFLEENAKENRFAVLIDKLNRIQPTVTDWTSLKKFLEEHKSQPRYLQMTLAPILREIALDLKQQDYEANGINPGEFNAFQAEFRDYIFNQFQLWMNEAYRGGGDIFSRFPAAIEKFDEASLQVYEKLSNNPSIKLEELSPSYNAKNSNQPLTSDQLLVQQLFEHEVIEALDRLNKWFKEQGYREFLDYQRNSGKWAADVELSPLSELFGIVLKIHKKTIMSVFFDFHGTLPAAAFNEQQLRLLKDRGIINRPPKGTDYLLLELTESELLPKLEALPSSERIIEYWLSQESQIKNQTKVKVPTSWIPNSDSIDEDPEGPLSYDCIQLLLDRGIITREDKSNNYCFIQMKADEFMDKVMAIEGYQQIHVAWKKNYKTLPFIMLSNPYELHWYYLQPKNYTHWDLSELEPKHSAVISETTLQQFLERANALDENSDEKFELGIEDGVETETTQTTMRNILYNLLKTNDDDDEISESGSSKSDEDSDLLGRSPPSYNLFIDSLPLSQQPFVSGDIAKLPYNETEKINLTDDTDFQIKRDTYGFPMYRFFSPTSSPPYKKQKAESESFEYISTKLAEQAKDSLNSFTMHHNPDIASHADGLIKAFSYILKNHKIPGRYSMQLLLPKEYLSMTGKDVEFLPPDEVLNFIAQHLHQILFHANSQLAQTVRDVYISALQSGNIMYSNAITLLNKIFTDLNSHLVLTAEVRQTISEFNLDEIKDLPHQLSVKLRQLFINCKLIAQKMDIKNGARNILSYPEINNYKALKDLFEEVKDKDLTDLDNGTINFLLTLEIESIKEQNLRSEVDAFKKLHQHDLFKNLKGITLSASFG